LVERENLLNYEEVRDELMNLGDYQELKKTFLFSAKFENDSDNVRKWFWELSLLLISKGEHRVFLEMIRESKKIFDLKRFDSFERALLQIFFYYSDLEAN
jgi:hypothetical protein